jgi:hypothetical protein
MSDIVQRLRMIVASGNGGHFEEHLMEAAEEIERLREAHEWIAVGDRLPEQYQSVVVALTPDSQGRVDVCEAVHWKGSDFQTDKGTYECSHWMPLPRPPAKS